ncbi:MAG: phospholipid carrier-dependent glycosyltransferase [Planctomycetaceae bacterium]
MTPAHRVWRWRLATVLSSVVAGAVTGFTAAFGRATASSSPLLWGVTCIAGLASLLLVLLLCLSEERWHRLLEWLSTEWSLFTGVAECETPCSRQVRVALGIALIAATCNLGLCGRCPTASMMTIRGAFLRTATEIADAGGPVTLARQLVSGEFREANRHPLYLAFLAIQPTEPWGRTLSLLFAVLALGLALGWLWCRGETTAAVLTAALLGTNRVFAVFSARVVCETLLMLTTLLAWLAFTHWQATRRHNPDNAGLGRSGWPLLTGAALGLAWLTKGTGLLLLLGTLLTIGIVWWRSADRRPSRWLFWSGCVSVAFLVVASPLLVRNARRFGSLTYNVNSQLLFVDTYEDPERLAEERSTAAAARAYLASHSTLQLVRREASGLVWESFILLRSLGPVGLDDARVLLGLLLLPLAGLGFATSPQLPRLLTLVWLASLVVVFAWYVPIAAGERFLIPVTVPLLLAAAMGIARLLRRLVPDQQHADRWLIAGVMLWSVLATGAHYLEFTLYRVG